MWSVRTWATHPTRERIDKGCSMEDKKVLLSIKDLKIKFQVRGRTLTAIRGISLDIYENESIAIVGESAAGKSVFTKTFAGMLDTNGYISEGSIIFNDDELSDTKVSLDAQAKRLIASCKKCICAVEEFGPLNEANQELEEYARGLGKLKY